MAAILRRRRGLDESPTYNHGFAPATPPLPFHAFAASRHHVAAQLASMPGYDDEVDDDDNEPCVHAPTCQMSADGQPRQYSHAPDDDDDDNDDDDDDTPTRRQKLPCSSPGSQHACMTARPAPEAPYAGLAPGPALLAARANASDKVFDMLPPPDSVHASWQALHDYAQSHAAEHGYALSINTTAKNRSRIKLACVCYGQPKNTHKLTAETRVRKNRVSYKTGCKMWIEGKKLHDGTWLLRVGEPQHNHPGRDSAGWAVQRKRTWGLVGGRRGVGGVTAKEELAQRRLSGAEGVDANEASDTEAQAQKPSTHTLERGGLVWKIVEQEMLRKNKPTHGRDRGVGRTVDVLQLKLPGIHILKRDVYNIRAQIKRARKAAGQELGEGVDTSADEDDDDDDVQNDDVQNADVQDAPLHPPQMLCPAPHDAAASPARAAPQINPCLAPSFSSPPALPSPSLSDGPDAAATHVIQQLRRENAALRRLLADKTQEVREKTVEMAGLRSQVELLSNMVLTSGRGVMAG